MLSKECRLQLKETGMSRGEHFRFALSTALRLQVAVLAMIVHSLAPRCFINIAERFARTKNG